MPDPATTETPAAVEPVEQVEPAPTTPEAVKPEAPTPPWGSDDEFDPKKAWDLIQNLRAQKNDPTAAKKLAELEKFKTDAEDAQRTESERLTLRAEQAEKVAADKDSELARTKAALKYRLSDEDAAALDGIPVDRIEAVAERLASRTPTPAVPDTTGQGAVGKPIGGVDQLTQADLTNMSPEQVNQARRDGRLKNVLGGTS